MIKNFLLFIFFTLALSNAANATHIVGGEIFYDSLGNNKYRITLLVYRDCGSATMFDSPLEYTIFNPDGSVFSVYSLNYTTITPLAIIPDPCVIIPTGVCIERALYVDTVTLPFNALGYTVSYQRCCWANTLVNIVTPELNGITITTFIPGSSMVQLPNQSARFTNLPPLVLCSQRPFLFDHSATDPDGDSLVYEIIPTYQGGGGSAITDPESPPPYTNVTWEVGFSGVLQFGPGSNMTINAATGMLVYTPNGLGQFVTGVGVKEYRAGILVNSSIRTFAFRVVVCDSLPPYDISLLGDPFIIEDCGNVGIQISREDSTDAKIFNLIIGGTATNGVDYVTIPSTVIMDTNVGSISIPISTLVDNVAEGNETINITLIFPNVCNGTADTLFFTCTIGDYKLMEITQGDTIKVCSDFGENANQSAIVAFGVPGYSYDWQPGFYPDNDSVFLPSTIFVPGTNNYTLSVLDQCGKIATKATYVINQCPLIAPNILTLNSDGVNEFFVIQNLEDYESVELIVVNRWGDLIYENANYKNDWSGTGLDGKKIIDGTYFYLATPKSEKYEYDDNEKSRFTASGFVQIVR
jgi:gliding motility-associated-like protein